MNAKALRRAKHGHKPNVNRGLVTPGSINELFAVRSPLRNDVGDICVNDPSE
jgi:hypothetical protein